MKNLTLLVTLTGLLFSHSMSGQFMMSLGGSISGGNVDDPVNSDIAVDGEGNSYIYGSLDLGISNIDLDPSSATLEFSSGCNGCSNIFLASYSADGSLRFAHTQEFVSENAITVASRIAVDANDNIYVTGFFNGIVDFDPSEESAELISSSLTVFDGFVCSYTADGEFRFVFPIALGISASNYLLGEYIDIKTDDNNNILISGRLYPLEVDFDPSGETLILGNEFNTQSNTYVAKYDSFGELLFAFEIDPYIVNGYELSVDPAGNSYLSGFVNSPVDFDPDTTQFIVESEGFTSYDFVVAKYNEDGSFNDAFKIDLDQTQSVLFSSGQLTRPPRISHDASGNINVVGKFHNIADFDPDSVGIFELDITNTLNSPEMFYASYENNGSFRNAFMIGDEENLFDTLELARNTDIVTDEEGNVYITGYYEGSLDFDPSSGESFISSINDQNDNGNFLVSYDNEGNLRYVVDLMTYYDFSTQVAVNGNEACVTGIMNGEIAFNTETLEYENIGTSFSRSLLVTCFDENGSALPDVLPTRVENQIELTGMVIFPNPSADAFTVKIPGANSGRIEVVDIQGRAVMTEIVQGELTRINSRELAKGQYLIRVIGNSSALKMRRFIKM